MSSRQNKKETILSIGYTTDKKEVKMFNKCLNNGLGIKYKKGGKDGVQKGRAKTK